MYSFKNVGSNDKETIIAFEFWFVSLFHSSTNVDALT